MLCGTLQRHLQSGWQLPLFPGREGTPLRCAIAGISIAHDGQGPPADAQVFVRFLLRVCHNALTFRALYVDL